MCSAAATGHVRASVSTTIVLRASSAAMAPMFTATTAAIALSSPVTVSRAKSEHDAEHERGGEERQRRRIHGRQLPRPCGLAIVIRHAVAGLDELGVGRGERRLRGISFGGPTTCVDRGTEGHDLFR